MAVCDINCHGNEDSPMTSMNVSVPDPMRDLVQLRRDQMQADEQEAPIAALIKGEKIGISKRRIPEILASVKQELQRQSE
jgi:antitoxin ParD1/3/4